MKPRRPQSRFTRQPESPNVHMSESQPSSHHQNSTKGPQEREERMKIVVGEGKKSAKCWLPPILRTPTLCAPPFGAPTFSSSPLPSGPPSFWPPTHRASTRRAPTLRPPPFGPPPDNNNNTQPPQQPQTPQPQKQQEQQEQQYTETDNHPLPGLNRIGRSWPKSKLAEVEIGRSRKKELAEVEIGRSRSRSTQHTTHNTQHTAHSTQHTAHSTQHTAHTTQHTTHNTQHTTHNTQHTTHNTQHTTHNQEPATKNQQPRTSNMVVLGAMIQYGVSLSRSVEPAAQWVRFLAVGLLFIKLPLTISVWFGVWVLVIFIESLLMFIIVSVISFIRL